MNSRKNGRLPSRALVIVVRGLPVNFIGAYGNEWVRTPTLDRLASRGIVFDQHFATSNRVADAEVAWTGGDTDFIHKLNRAGVFTARIRTHHDAAQPFGWVEELVANPGELPTSLRECRRMTYAAMEAIPSTAPALVWIDVDALVPPWKLPKRYVRYYFDGGNDGDQPIVPWTEALPRRIETNEHAVIERLQNTFAALVSAVDRSLALFLAGCRRRGFGSNALTLITSDLGMEMAEHGGAGRDGPRLSEAMLHLPLIIRRPDNEFAGLRVSGLTQPSDLGATLAGYFSVDSANASNSLWPMLNDLERRNRDCLVTTSDEATALRTEDRLLVLPVKGDPELYFKPGDRWEVNNLAQKNEGDVEQLLALLNRAANRNPGRPEDANANAEPSDPRDPDS